MRRTRRNALAALGVVLAVLAVLCVPSALAFAEEDTQPDDGAGTHVAQIGETKYATIEDALDAATESEEETVTITMLQSCSIAGRIVIPKDRTFVITADEGSNITITDTGRYGINSNGSLTMENITYTTNGQIALNGTTDDGPFGRVLTFRNVKLTMDGEKYQFNTIGYYCGAIFADSPADLVFENCEVNINNYTSQGSAIRWNGKNNDTGYGVTINNSIFNSSNCYSAFVGTLDLLIENSEVNVKKERGNGSNGSNYTIKNSEVNFIDNGSHGISAGNLSITDHSVVTADDNGLYGVYASKSFYVDGTSQLFVRRNSSKGDYAGLKITSGVNDGQVEAGAEVTITNNYCSGLSNNGVVTFDEGVKLTITENVNDKGTTSYGGGIYNSGSSAKLILPSDAVIYNNHADTAGDDIYNGASSEITFSRVGSGWILDDCNHAITGWFDDSKDARWEAHSTTANHVKEFTEFERNDTATVTKLTCLKAAHGLLESDASWDISKSKTATNLDENYESDVTLSLPSAEEELTYDVVFVLDKSTSANVESQIVEMLKDLCDQVEETEATVKVGVVIFNKEANITCDLIELNKDNLSAIETAIQKDISSGTNTHAGLLAGQAMLEDDTAVEDSHKYLVFVSDGITYMYNTDEYGVTGIGLENADHNTALCSPDNWSTKYGSDSSVPADWGEWLTTIGEQIDQDGTQYEAAYQGDYKGTGNYIAYEDRDDHVMAVDKALYETYQVYQEMASKYNCYAVLAEVNTKTEYVWAKSFMNYLAGGETWSFEDIEKDILYLLDAGSSVVDIIGYGTDNDGNVYDFDFVDDLESLTLTVGGVEQTKEIMADPQFTDPYVTSAYGFGMGESTAYAYELYYYANGRDGASDECFVWKINVPVSNFAPVQLTYGVRLTNPQAESGTYGTYDATGEHGYDSLLTNVSATLYPVDSNGEQGVPEYFYKPTVSYTVEDENPDGGGGTVTTGSLIVTKQVTGDQASAEDEFTFRITLTGVSDKDANRTYSGIAFTNGVAEITLHGGDSVRISGLPAGAKYTVEEIDGLDYTLTSSSGTSGTITAGSTKTAKFVNDKSEADLEPTDPVYPGVEKDLTGRDLVAGEFTFVLTAQGDAPMPGGATGGTATATNQADGTVVFGGITFTEEGTYTYTISEVAGNEEGMTYDSSTHTLVVTVADADGDGKLEVTGLTYDGGTSLPVFTNSYEGTDEPEEPAEPEDPSEPDEPSDPEQPGSTDEPGDVDEPTRPVKPTTPVKPTIPETGDDTSYLPVVGLLLGGCALAAAGLVLRRRLSR